MINPNNIRQLAESISDILDTLIPESKFERLTEKQRAYLASLAYQWSIGSKTAIPVIKDILGIKSRMVDKKEGYLINKGIIKLWMTKY